MNATYTQEDLWNDLENVFDEYFGPEIEIEVEIDDHFDHFPQEDLSCKKNVVKIEIFAVECLWFEGGENLDGEYNDGFKAPLANPSTFTERAYRDHRRIRRAFNTFK
jgi:hypothetical protein